MIGSTEPKADVSVIIAVYNGEKYLEQCLESVLNQSVQPREIIVVDDGSTDHSAQIVQSLDSVNYTKTVNGGVAKARNKGVSIAKSKWVAFIDQDDYWTINSLKIRFNYLQENKANSIVIGKQHWFLDGLPSAPSWVREEQLKKEQDGYLLGCALMEKGLFERYGHFDETLRFASDYDWFFRLKDNQEPFAQVDEVVLKKRIHPLNESRHASESLQELVYSLRRSINRKRTL